MSRSLVHTLVTLTLLLLVAAEVRADADPERPYSFGYSRETFTGGFEPPRGVTVFPDLSRPHLAESAVISIGFPFRYQGSSHSTCNVSTNGWVGFGPDTTNYNGETCPTRRVALFQRKDLYQTALVPCVYFRREGSAPNRVLTIHYWRVRCELDARVYLSGMIKLHEDGTIELIYGPSFLHHRWVGWGLADQPDRHHMGGHHILPEANFRFRPRRRTFEGLLATDAWGPASGYTVRLVDGLTGRELNRTVTNADGIFRLEAWGCPSRVVVQVANKNTAVRSPDPYWATGREIDLTWHPRTNPHIDMQPVSTDVLLYLETLRAGFEYVRLRLPSSTIPRLDLEVLRQSDDIRARYEPAGSGDARLTLDSTDRGRASAAVLLAAYGRHVLASLSPRSYEVEHDGEDRFLWGDPSRPSRAWSFGWGAYFAGAVSDGQLGTREFWPRDLGTPNREGWADVPASIATLLWNIHDGSEGRFDRFDGYACLPPGGNRLLEAVLALDRVVPDGDRADIHMFLEAWLTCGYAPQPITHLFIYNRIHFDTGFEPNDSVADAVLIRADTARLGFETASPWNSDYFLIHVPESDVTLEVRIEKLSPPDAPGDAAIGLVLVDPGGDGPPPGGERTEVVTLHIASPGDYFVKVSGARGGQSVRYAIRYRIFLQGFTGELPDWTVGRPYDRTLQIRGGVGNLTWTTVDSLPEGLELVASAERGQARITGTPTAPGTYEITVQVADQPGTSRVSRTFHLTINPATEILTETLPDWTRDHDFSLIALEHDGGTGHLSWTLASGTLPPGLELDPATGEIRGRPNESGRFTFTLRAVDEAGCVVEHTYVIVVADPLELEAAPLPDWTVGAAFDRRITAVGGTGAASFALTDGALPAGLDLSATGRLTGHPEAQGLFRFTLTATDVVGDEAAIDLVLRVNPAPHLEVVAFPGNDWTEGQPLEIALRATGGTVPLSIDADGLGPNLTLEVANGTARIAGAPGRGALRLTVRVTDARGVRDVEVLEIEVHDRPAILTETLPDWTRNHDFAPIALEHDGGTGRLAWTVASGALPRGLELDPTTGEIRGRPTESGRFTFTLRAVDEVGSVVEHTYVIVIADPLELEAAPLPEWTVGAAFDRRITAVGGTGTASFALTGGTLPAGLDLSAAGRLTGRPEASGLFRFALTATDTVGDQESIELTLRVNPAPRLEVIAFPGNDWTADQPLEIELRASGGTPPLSIDASGLGPDLTMEVTNATARIAGAPGRGALRLTVRVTDARGVRDVEVLEIEVHDRPAIGAIDALLIVDRPCDIEIPVAGGTPPLEIEIAEGALPAGVYLDAAGRFGGTPREAGPFPVRIRIVDRAGARMEAMLRLRVARPIRPGETLSDPVASDDAARYYVVDLLRQSDVSLTVKCPKGAGRPGLRILDRLEREESLAGCRRLKISSRKISLKGWTVPRTDRFFVEIDNSAARRAGSLTLKLKAKAPKAPSGLITLPADGSEATLSLPALAGSVLKKLQLRAPVGLAFEIVSVRGPDGLERPWRVGLREKKDGFQIRKLPLDESGEYRVTLRATGGVGGQVAFKAKIGAPRQYLLVLP